MEAQGCGKIVLVAGNPRPEGIIRVLAKALLLQCFIIRLCITQRAFLTFSFGKFELAPRL